MAYYDIDDSSFSAGLLDDFSTSGGAMFETQQPRTLRYVGNHDVDTYYSTLLTGTNTIVPSCEAPICSSTVKTLETKIKALEEKQAKIIKAVADAATYAVTSIGSAAPADLVALRNIVAAGFDNLKNELAKLA